MCQNLQLCKKIHHHWAQYYSQIIPNLLLHTGAHELPKGGALQVPMGSI